MPARLNGAEPGERWWWRSSLRGSGSRRVGRPLPAARPRHGLGLHVDLTHPVGIDLILAARLTKPASLDQRTNEVEAYLFVVGVLLEEPQAVPDRVVDFAGRCQRGDQRAEQCNVRGSNFLGEGNGPLLVEVILEEAAGVNGECRRKQVGGVWAAAPVGFEGDV